MTLKQIESFNEKNIILYGCLFTFEKNYEKNPIETNFFISFVTL